MITAEQLAERFERNGRPYAAEYIRKYGIESQAPCWRTERTFLEELYKECLEKGVRWEEIYIPETNEDITL